LIVVLSFFVLVKYVLGILFLREMKRIKNVLGYCYCL
jgi:hypothetical protein